MSKDTTDPLAQLAADAEAFDPSIDVLELDKEWLGQGKLHRTWLRHLAKAKQDLREKQNDLAATKAQLSNKVRQDPEVWKLKANPSVDAVTDIVICQPTYKQKQLLVSEAQYLVDIVAANCDVCETRRRGIQDLVDLYRLNYWADPRHAAPDVRSLADVPCAQPKVDAGKVLGRVQSKLAEKQRERKSD